MPVYSVPKPSFLMMFEATENGPPVAPSCRRTCFVFDRRARVRA